MAFTAPDPGEMRWRVTIYTPTVDGIDERGKPKITDEPLCKDRYARWTEYAGKDISVGEELRHARTAEIVMRWISGVVPLCKIAHRGDAEPWQVVSVIDPTGRQQWLRVIAEKVVMA